MRNRVGILRALKKRGIWLIDTSIVGMYRGAINDPDMKARVIRDSWDEYIGDLVSNARPKHIIVIGKVLV